MRSRYIDLIQRSTDYTIHCAERVVKAGSLAPTAASGYSLSMRKNIMLMLMAVIAITASCDAKRPDNAPNGNPNGNPSAPEEDTRVAKAVSALATLPADAAKAIETAIRADAGTFFDLLAAVEAESAAAGDLLVLVDKERSLPDGYEPGDLVSLNDYPLAVTRKDLRLRKAVMDAVLEMDAAAKADGVRLVFASSYRSYEYQDGLFKRYAAAHGEAEASRFSARPGTSQHQLGTAIDFDPIDEAFDGTKAGAWMAANAGRFGFSLSFPRGMEAVTGYIWESWHFRYITKPGAALERDYFGGVQQYLMEFLDAYRKTAGR